jgi:hypothetical protein
MSPTKIEEVKSVLSEKLGIGRERVYVLDLGIGDVRIEIQNCTVDERREAEGWMQVVFPMTVRFQVVAAPKQCLN